MPNCALNHEWFWALLAIHFAVYNGGRLLIYNAGRFQVVLALKFPYSLSRGGAKETQSVRNSKTKLLQFLLQQAHILTALAQR
jgi:hypothetical protein